jgi:hypothetical protein
VANRSRKKERWGLKAEEHTEAMRKRIKKGENGEGQKTLTERQSSFWKLEQGRKPQ